MMKPENGRYIQRTSGLTFTTIFPALKARSPDKGEMSVRVMVTHDMIQSPEDDLPEAVYAVGSYETAFR